MALIVDYAGSTPTVASTAWVAPNATLVGRVTLADRASVFYSSVLRADMDSISIGVGSNLQDNVTVHCDEGFPTAVGDGVSVGHGAILHGCTIEDNCLIGMGATIMNGAVIGTGSLVAAGALVLEGTIVPPGSLVAGVPAKVRRELDEGEIASLRVNAQHYLVMSAAHREAIDSLSSTD